MKNAAKAALLLSGVATLMASMPAEARSRHHGNDRIDAGDIIAGALIIGGIAAIASAGSRDRDYRDGRYYDDGYGYGYARPGYGSRWAVENCVRAAQREASRYGWARVTDVTRIERERGGYEVRGRLVVEDRGYRGWRGDRDRYGYRYDRYGDGYDKGKFRCETRYDRVVDVRLSGLDRY